MGCQIQFSNTLNFRNEREHWDAADSAQIERYVIISSSIIGSMTSFINSKQINLNWFIPGMYRKLICAHMFSISGYFRLPDNFCGYRRWQYFSVKNLMIEKFNTLGGKNSVSTHEQTLKTIWNFFGGFHFRIYKRTLWGSGIARCILSIWDVSSFHFADDNFINAREQKINFSSGALVRNLMGWTLIHIHTIITVFKALCMVRNGTSSLHKCFEKCFIGMYIW